jgi:hypothetical protein
VKDYLADLIPRLKQYSARLDNLALLTDQPWVKVDTPESKIVYIFRSQKNELLISRNGNVSTCRWEYLETMDSLVIEEDGEKRLFKQGFFDESAMILRKDGQEEFLLLVNENKIDLRERKEITDHLSQKYIMKETTGEGDLTDTVDLEPPPPHEIAARCGECHYPLRGDEEKCPSCQRDILWS